MTDPSYDEDNLREDIALPDETDDGDVKETNANIILFSGGSLKHAFSGATGSVFAMATFYPLDTIRTRLQIDDKRKAKPTWKVIKELCEEEGIGTLYRGLVPVLSSLYCSNFVYFYTFHGIRKLCLSKTMKQNPTQDLLIGYFAGLVNSMITTPLWVANTRLKLQGIKFKQATEEDQKQRKYKGLFDALNRIAKEEGISALWSGIRTSFLLSGNPAIQFMAYESIKRFFNRIKTASDGKIKAISNLEYFIMGGTAKAIATVLTYPLQLAQCRLRAGKDKRGTSKEGLFKMLFSIYEEKGLLGLFKGLEAKLMQTVLTASLMFVVYEKLVAFISTLVRGKLLAKSM